MPSATELIEMPFAAHIRPDRAVLKVRGEGALAFLHNLLTADLREGVTAYAALLSPQGKILHDVFVVPAGDEVWIDCAAAQADDLLKRLAMYRLRAKLDIGRDETKAVAVSLANELPGLSYADPRLAEMGFRGLVGAKALPIGGAYDEHRLAWGIADSTRDIGSGQLFVHEANLDQLNAVSFSKGCYVGQEVVSRTHHRSTARNRILPVTLGGAVPPGTAVTAGEMRLGEMLSSEGGLGLALLRLDKLAECKQPLKADGVLLSVRKPVWAKFDLVMPEIVT